MANSGTTSVVTGDIELPGVASAVGWRIVFTLNRVDTDGTQVVIPQQQVAIVQSDGAITISLWRTASGSANAWYDVTAVSPDSQTTVQVGQINVPDAASANLNTLLDEFMSEGGFNPPFLAQAQAAVAAAEAAADAAADDASAAQAAAADAAISAAEAEASALAAGAPIFADTVLGILGTSNTDLFYVPSNGALDIYENVAGVATYVNTILNPCFPTVAAFAADVTAGYTAEDGTVVSAGPVQFQAQSSAAYDGLPAGWVPFGNVTPVHFGADPLSSGDDGNSLNEAINYALNNPGGFHAKVFIPPGRYRYSVPTLIDHTLVGSENEVKSLIIEGTGSRASAGSDIRFMMDDPTVDAFTIVSGFQVIVRDLSISGEGAKKNLALVDAGDSPVFAGHLVVFDNCYFRSFGATPTEAVFHAKNSKLVRLTNSYVGTQVTGDTSIILGGNEADNAAKNLNGKLALAEICNNYIWGLVEIKNAGELIFTGNQMVEGSNGIHTTGDGILNNAIISHNYFAESSLNSRIAIDIKAAPLASGRVGAGAIRIEHNRIRRKAKGIRVDGTGPIIIGPNSWELVTGATCGIEVLATASNVEIQPQYDQALLDAGLPVVLDNRHVFGTDEPTVNVDKSIVIDAALSADVATISENNTNQNVLTSKAVKLRGGLYRVRVCVTVRCTDATDDLPFNVLVRLSRPGRDVNLGIFGGGLAPNTSRVSSTVWAHDTFYVERIVYLPPDEVSGAASTTFKVVVRNTSSAVTPASGFVDGSSMLADAATTWLQVENLGGGVN